MEKDYAKALEHYEIAASNGQVVAMMNAGLCRVCVCVCAYSLLANGTDLFLAAQLGSERKVWEHRDPSSKLPSGIGLR